MSDVSPVDQAARDRFCREWRRNFAVSANAGSGKTTAISERLAVMALDPAGAEVLRRTAVVTYTVKAAAEIAERARERLLQKLAAGDGATGDGLAALEHLERAFFGTLHSFCLKLAREHGLESGLDPAPEVLVSTEDVDAVWEDFLAEDPMVFTVLDEARRAALFRHVEMEAVLDRAKDLPASVATALVRRAPSGPPPSPAWSEWEALLGLPAKGAGKANLLASQEKARAWRRRYEAAAEEGIFLGIFEPEGKAAELVRTARRWMAPLLGWVAPAAGAIAGELALRFQDYRRVRGVQTYEDQVATTRALLERPDTLETVRREGWRVILDEAQDTDEAQFSVLVEIARPPGAERGTWPGSGAPPRPGHFCMVGDGQQAIYSSRASVRTFQRFLGAFEGGETGDALHFEVTFRAPHAVVALLNSTLPAAFSPEREHNRGLPVESGADEPCLQVPYQALRAGPKNLAGDVRRIELSGVADSKPRGGDTEKFQTEMRQVAAWLRSAGLAGAGVAEWGELCVLVPRNGWMDAAVNALQAEGLKVARQSKRLRAGDQPVYAWLTGLLAVCCFPDDDYEWIGVMRSVFGVSDAILAAEKRRVGRFDWETPDRHGEPVRAAIMALRSSLLTVDDENVLLDVWVGRLIEACGLAAKARALDTDGGAWRELARLQAEARALANEGLSPRGWWARLLRGREANGKSGRPEPDAINLMTCHSAKGLEWPAVLAPGLWRKVSFDSEKGLHVLSGADGEPRVYLKAGYVPEDTKQSRERERRRELVRLLYVTLTRARQTLLVPWAEGLMAAPGQSLGALWGHDLNLLPVAGIPPPEPRESGVERADEGGLKPAALSPALKRGLSGGIAAGYRRVLPHQLAHAVDVPRWASCEETPALEVAAGAATDPIAYGLWWHEAMEFLPWTAGRGRVEAYGQTRLEEAVIIGAGQRAKAEWNRLLSSSVWADLANPRWQRRAELAVLAPLGPAGDWIDGVIDLVLHDADAKEVWVVDWKTNRIGREELPATLLARLVTEYAPQLEAYGTSLGQVFPGCRIRAFIFSTALAAITEVAIFQPAR
jgi:ATP-dependent exoDNAse (exonuclease V) beta subunit